MLELAGREPLQGPRLRERRAGPARLLRGSRRGRPHRAAARGPRHRRDDLRERRGPPARPARLPLYDELRASFPPRPLRVPARSGPGARKVKALHDALGVDSLDALERACREGRLESVRGFGKKSAAHLLRGIAMVRASAGLFLHSSAGARARALVVVSLALRGSPRTSRLAGSLRRLREVVRNVDIVASSRSGAKLAEAFRAFPEVVDVARLPETPRTTVRFLDGLTADLRVVAPEEFAAALALLHRVAARTRPRCARGREPGLPARRAAASSTAAAAESRARSPKRSLRGAGSRLRRAGAAGRRRRDRGRRRGPPAAPWSPAKTCAASSTSTPTPPTAATTSRRWCARRRPPAMPTWPSRITASPPDTRAG